MGRVGKPFSVLLSSHQALMSFAALSIAALAIFSCDSQQGGNSNSSIQGLGALSPAQLSALVSKTDVAVQADGCSASPFRHAKIRIHKVLIRGEGGREIEFAEHDFDLDLANLEGAAEAVLNRARIPIGKYDQIRFITDGDGDGEHWNGSHGNVIVPSGSQTGVKFLLSQEFEVKQCKLNRVRIHIDFCSSFHALGRPENIDQGQQDFDDHSHHNLGDHDSNTHGLCSEDYHFDPVVHADMENLDDGDSCPVDSSGSGSTPPPAPTPSPSASQIPAPAPSPSASPIPAPVPSASPTPAPAPSPSPSPVTYPILGI